MLSALTTCKLDDELWLKKWGMEGTDEIQLHPIETNNFEIRSSEGSE
jgi:hypothetical protein